MYVDKQVDGFSAVEEVILRNVRRAGVQILHSSTHARTSNSGKTATKSTTIRFMVRQHHVKLSIIKVQVPEGVYYSGCIFNPGTSVTRIDKPMYTCGFANGEDASIDEIVHMLSEELIFFFGAQETINDRIFSKA